MLTVKQVGAKLRPLRSADIPTPHFMLKLQEDIKSSRELAADAEFDQLLFDVVLGSHYRIGRGFSFANVRDSFQYIRDKIGSMSEADIFVSYSILCGERVSSYRATNVLVGGNNIRAATYVPPDHKGVPSLMKDWRRYTNNICANPIIGIVVAVDRFLQIHPFIDGNGRMARMILFSLMLKNFGARAGVRDVARRMFSDGNHELIYLSLQQIRNNDWSRIFEIFNHSE